MRIMVFMITERKTSAPVAARDLNVPGRRIRFCGRSVCWSLGAAVYSWAAASTHATLIPLVSQSHPENLAAVSSSLSIIHGMEAFYPILGLLAAVASTYILRRRRVAQLAAGATDEG